MLLPSMSAGYVQGGFSRPHAAHAPPLVLATAASAASTPSRTLILSPPVSMATPRGWEAIAQYPSLSTSGVRYDQVHCVGGGSLLLFLLHLAGKAPRLAKAGTVFVHGEPIYPTSDSCSLWADAVRPGAGKDIDDEEWRNAAVSMGLGGRLAEPQLKWLEPLTRSIISGSPTVREQYDELLQASVDKGRLRLLTGKTEDEPAVPGVARIMGSNHEDALLALRCDEQACVFEPVGGRV